MGDLTGMIAALVPSLGVGLLFWFAMRAIVRADSAERAAIARLESAQVRQEKGDR
jgi:hypothetical protein